MVVEDWVIAFFVMVAATLLIYFVGRRLEGKVSKGGSAGASPRLAATPASTPAPAPVSAPTPTPAPARAAARESAPSLPPQKKEAPAKLETKEPLVVPLSLPASASTPTTPAAPEKKAKIARLDVEDDDDVDPTRVGKQAEEPAPQKVVYSPKIHAIVFDPEVRQPEAEGSQFLVHARAQTDPGLRRKRNEDSLLVLETDGVFVIADGMGGYRGGELASLTAVQTIEAAYRQKMFEGPAHPNVPVDATNLARAIQMANTAILDMAKSRPELTGMGTTICAARFSENIRRLYIGHVGDSRCYRLRGGEFRQITRDHTMADHGVKGREAVQLSRAVGVWPTVPIDIVMIAPVLGDVYMLCSDGLTKMLKDEAIGNVVRAEEDPQIAVERLVASANLRGGKDNISVILIRVVPPNWAPPPVKKEEPEPEPETVTVTVNAATTLAT
jgi:protein phosphatase